MIWKPKYTRNWLSLGDENYLPKGVVGDGVMEVDDEEEGGVFWCCCDLVVVPMEMKEEEDEAKEME